MSAKIFPMAGYSGTPLVKKLGIKEKTKLSLVNAPKNFLSLVSPLPPEVHISSKISANADIIHIFSTQKTELLEQLQTSLSRIKQDGAIWVSWPKKASQVTTDITENTIRELTLPLGLVDVKVCAVDETWSGLKLVIRKKLRRD